MDALPELVTTRQLAAAALTETERHALYRSDTRGLYAARWADETLPMHRITRALLLAGPASTIGGWAAAHVHELTARPPGDDLCVFDGARAYGEPAGLQPVLVLMAPEHRARPVPDRKVFRSTVPEPERQRWAGGSITTPLRTAFDLARLSGPTQGVVALDRLLGLRLVAREDLAALVAQRHSWRGWALAARALHLAEDDVRSPMETVMRLEWLRAGLPRPRCNAVVEDDDGRFVAMVDLLDEATGLVGEYDGGHHAGADRRRRDAIRRERLVEAHLTVVTATAVDLATPANRASWRARLVGARARAARRPAAWRLR